MTTDQVPEPIRTYQNHTLDSTRWHHYTPREDDVIVSTSYKSGTTWMQNIVLQLIYHGREVPPVWDVSPWVDFRPGGPIEELIDTLEAQRDRRCIKTHLALDGLPFYSQVKYIVVGRDARDVFMSWYNHYSKYTDLFYALLNDTPGRVGDPIPRCPQNINEYWRTWITRGWFEWESEGYPHSGNMHHTQTWWENRHLENILFVHFNDLLADLEGETRRVAQFLDIDLPEESIPGIVHAVSFSTVKAAQDPVTASDLWKGGMNTFFFKGTNGRWQGVLSEDELAMYETTRDRVLASPCALWLEKGRAAL
jgi:aryl sulfotransferase